MLVVLLGSFILSANMIDEHVNGVHVEYRDDLIPSCIIKMGKNYWEWRESLGNSDDVGRDLLKVYGYYIQSKKVGENEPDITNEAAICSENILMSKELSQIFNNYGDNVSSLNFYYQLISRDAVSGLQNSTKTLDYYEFVTVFRSSLKEVETRFSRKSINLPDLTGPECLAASGTEINWGSISMARTAIRSSLHPHDQTRIRTGFPGGDVLLSLLRTRRAFLCGDDHSAGAWAIAQ